MTVVAPSTPQLEALVARLVARRPATRLIGIHAGARGDWPDEIEASERRFQLRWIVSPLDAREQVALLDASDEPCGLVLLTNLSEGELGSDLVGRLARARLHAVDPWQATAQAFQATRSDPRLVRHPWMAEVLLAHRPSQGYAAVPGGFLDLDTAWRHAFDALLGLSDPRPDAVALLTWLQRPDADARFAALSADIRADLAQWIESQGDLATATIMAVIDGGYAADAAPLGLICRILFDPAHNGRAEIGEARGRLERFTGGKRVMPEAGRIWAGAAEIVMRQLQRIDAVAARRALDAADRLARDLQVIAWTRASPCLLSGFDGRLKDAANALAQTLDTEGGLQTAEASVTYALGHNQAMLQPQRADRLKMALRLARWLLQPERPPAADLSEAARHYADEGAFVDWARRALRGADDLADVAAAYVLLLQAADIRSEVAAKRFASLLARWSSAPSPLHGLVPVEDVLERLVAPLVTVHPVLLLVLDGLGLASALELLYGVESDGWSVLRPRTAPSLVGLAAIPSVTEVSRAALLTGKIGQGGGDVEKRGFAQHAALRRACGRRRSPQLFHKANIAIGTSARDAISAPDVPVVGVIHNAIDDQLSGSSQLDRPWSLVELLGLPAILYEARLAGRIVVVTADHGHVLENATTWFGEGDGARWRRNTGPLKEGEIKIAGARVHVDYEVSAIVALWTESGRYGNRRAGYHGGCSPQEMLVPLTVLCPAGVKPPTHWIHADRLVPPWW